VIHVRRRWLLLVLGLVVLALALELARFGQSPEYVGFDFHAYAGAARVGVQSGWAHIYDQGLVRAAERLLVPYQPTERFISPPPVAWLAAVLTPLPFGLAYGVWAFLILSALAFALAWSTSYRGPARQVAVVVALIPWWVLHALYVGQVVPLIAAGVLVAWRLVRENRDVAAGIVLAVVVLKPQTAAVAPLALLAAGRFRAFAAWLAAAATVVGTSLLTVGPNGLAEYAGALNGLPTSSVDITLGGAFGLTGPALGLAGVLIVIAALVTAYRLRSAPGLAIAAGLLASLLATPYLYENDLCLLGAAGWIVWHELPTRFWRAFLVTIWILAVVTGLGAPILRQWPLVELALFLALLTTAWFGFSGRSDWAEGEA
jgi:hypothetical protein